MDQGTSRNKERTSQSGSKMGTDLGELKESKLLTYKVGVSSLNYSILLLAAASSRSRAKEVF